MKLVINPDWGANFERVKPNTELFYFGTTDDGAIILESLDATQYIALIPGGRDKWVKLYFSANPTYFSYFVGTIEEILEGMGMISRWIITEGKDIIAGHGLTEKFNSLIRGE